VRRAAIWTSTRKRFAPIQPQAVSVPGTICAITLWFRLSNLANLAATLPPNIVEYNAGNIPVIFPTRTRRPTPAFPPGNRQAIEE